jgi:hypothetical protein
MDLMGIVVTGALAGEGREGAERGTTPAGAETNEAGGTTEIRSHSGRADEEAGGRRGPFDTARWKPELVIGRADIAEGCSS